MLSLLNGSSHVHNKLQKGTFLGGRTSVFNLIFFLFIRTCSILLFFGIDKISGVLCGRAERKTQMFCFMFSSFLFFCLHITLLSYNKYTYLHETNIKTSPSLLPVKTIRLFHKVLLVINGNLCSTGQLWKPRPHHFCGSSLLMMFFRSVTSGFCRPSSQLFMKPP